jgi:hypothetical protein
MTAPLSAERVEKLKQWLWHPAPKYYSLTTRDDIRRDIEVIIDDDSSLRAENELLNNNAMNDYAAHLELKARAEKSEAQLAAMRAENERLRAEFSTLKKAYDDECAWRGRGYRDLLTRAEQAEAQLEKQAFTVLDLLSALDSYSSMRADWDKIPEIRADKIRYKIRAEQAEAQLAKQKETIKLWQDRADELDKECREQFAQLAKQAPLIEAAEKWDGRMTWGSVRPLIQSIDDYRAALKYREERGEK